MVVGGQFKDQKQKKRQFQNSTQVKLPSQWSEDEKRSLGHSVVHSPRAGRASSLPSTPHVQIEPTVWLSSTPHVQIVPVVCHPLPTCRSSQLPLSLVLRRPGDKCSESRDKIVVCIPPPRKSPPPYQQTTITALHRVGQQATRHFDLVPLPLLIFFLPAC